MKLSLEGISNREVWKNANITLPSYDYCQIRKNSLATPVWLHFGIGNIFRIFIGSIADQLLANGELASGISCAEAYDFEVVDKIYNPYDNLMLSVILNSDGTTNKRVLAPFSEAIKAAPSYPKDWERLKDIFKSKSLQLVSFTITEKGYALTGANGSYFPIIKQDFESGPRSPHTAMTILTAMLYERFLNGKYPLALVSMDNCAHNGQRLQNAVICIAKEWAHRGLVKEGFEEYLTDPSRITFPWTMIDKITPRPNPSVAKSLSDLGVENMNIVTTDKHTFIAPFGNAERAQYLVIEDSFPNGRPPLENAGVYMTDRETVNRSERMKVCTCLNPIHTALCTYDCMLGYKLFADGMHDKELSKLAHLIGYDEGLKVVTDPGILSPKAFLDEVINERMSNPYLGDTSQRIAVDISQMVGIRFGETIKSYMTKYGTARNLVGIPLAIAGWLRYLLEIDDNGEHFDLAPDPMIPELQSQMNGIVFGHPESTVEKLRPILSNTNIFGVNLYKAGIGNLIEEMFRQEIDGKGAVRNTLKQYLK